MRITLDREKALNVAYALNTVCDTEEFKKVFDYKNDPDFVKNFKYLADIIIEEYQKPIKTTKRNATKKATNIRVENAKNKIINTINLMLLENKKINVNSVSKESKVSYNTVKKYKYLLEEYNKSL